MKENENKAHASKSGLWTVRNSFYNCPIQTAHNNREDAAMVQQQQSHDP